jgi:hypothetical protein
MTSWDFYWWKIIAVFDHPSRVLAQIVWHEPVDIPGSSATSDSHLTISMDNVFHQGNQRFRSWSCMSARPLINISSSSSIFKMFEPFVGRHRELHATCCGFLQLYSLLWKGIQLKFLLLYGLHTQYNETTAHSITEIVIKSKQNIRSTWNKMACIANGEVASSFKQHLTRLMHCWFMDKFQELSEHTIYCDRFDSTSDINADIQRSGTDFGAPTQRFSEYTGQRNINPLLPNW